MLGIDFGYSTEKILGAGGNDSYVKSLLHMNGPDSSTTFTDDAAGGSHTWTAYGNAQIDTAQSQFGGASGLFDGSGDYIQTPYSSDFDLGAGDFTWDFRVRWNVLPTSGQTQCLITIGRITDNNNVVTVYLTNVAGTLRLLFVAIVGGVTKASYQFNWTPVAGTWYHIAIVRQAWDLLIFIDGTMQTLTVNTAISNNSITLAVNEATTIGRYGGYTSYDFNGWLDEVRISKGIARWVSNFTPPTGEYS
jgi:hypothetical protein